MDANIHLPEFSLVVLVGAAGAGKSTFAREHFKATEVVREHYQDTGEDSYSMVYMLDESVLEDPVPTNRIAKQFEN